MYPVNASKMRPRSGQQAQTVPFPAPSRGINALSNLAEMTPADAIYSFNLISAPYGLKVRSGYREWATNVGSGGVRTVIPYLGSVAAANRMFACAEDGIYDVSGGGSSPTQVVTFPVVDDTSGYGVFFATTNSSGAYFLCYTDETNGYYVYTETGSSWAKIAMGSGGTEISGVDPADFCFVMSWKNRLWFIQKNTGDAWYLTVGALYGAATKFAFGNKFRYGGHLQALYDWTVDGGIGVDDYLVGIGSGGDVIVYQGTDPSSASTIDQRGAYYIGPPPAGRRIGGSYGGELFLLSTYGLLPITKLLSGQVVGQSEDLISSRITPLINNKMALTRESLGWEVRFIPSQTLLMIAAPKESSEDHIQFVQSINTQGWSLYRSFPYTTGDTWEGSFYFGDEDNRILIHEGDTDIPAAAEENIEWSVLTSFQDLGFSGTNKVVQFIRPTFVGAKTPGYSVQAIYDYNLLENSGTIVPPPIVTGNVWDVALWDADVWGGELFTSNNLSGANGIGRTIAIAMRGSSNAEVILVNFAVTATGGNVL